MDAAPYYYYCENTIPLTAQYYNYCENTIPLQHDPAYRPASVARVGGVK